MRQASAIPATVFFVIAAVGTGAAYRLLLSDRIGAAVWVEAIFLIAAILAGANLDFHDLNRIINILNHFVGLFRIDDMALTIVKFCLQYVEFSPGLGLGQIAVMRNQIRAIGTDSPVVRTNTGASAAKSKDGGSDHAAALKLFAQRLIHVL